MLSFREYLLKEGAMSGEDAVKHQFKYLSGVLKDIKDGKPIKMKDGQSFIIKDTAEMESLRSIIANHLDPYSVLKSGSKFVDVFTATSGEKFSWTNIEKTPYSIGAKDAGTLTHLKPSLFLGDKERFSSVEELITALIKGIESSTKVGPALKKDLINLIHAVKSGSNHVDLSFEGAAYVNMISKDFGEALGPIKIMTDPSYMPWIPRKNYAIYLPKKSNYPLVDYVIFDTSTPTPLPYKISAKVLKGYGNTVKVSDLEQVINSSSDTGIINKLKKSASFKLLFSVFDEINGKGPNSRKFGPLSAFGPLYAAAVLNPVFKDVISYLDSQNVKDLSLKDLHELKILDDSLRQRLKSSINHLVQGKLTGFEYVVDVLVAAGHLLKIETKEGRLQPPLKAIVNVALSNQVFYAKFGVDAKGQIGWDVRGGIRSSGYKFDANGKMFNSIYLDTKGGNGTSSRVGKDSIGLRIESLMGRGEVLEELTL